ncbi:hypothetical protein EX30DRAFT_82909 [Ascodesmis nigricans]|uniref:Uncharacterized protein n=1 Tax=Ascodesmis nigricans TaxID=341454 RepID=A0A4S2N2V9_9PEZI|nr:hypothetical protein EX30DRAFT_82909 [Ascodesmis nigricans]
MSLSGFIFSAKQRNAIEPKWLQSPNFYSLLLPNSDSSLQTLCFLNFERWDLLDLNNSCDALWGFDYKEQGLMVSACTEICTARLWKPRLHHGRPDKAINLTCPTPIVFLSGAVGHKMPVSGWRRGTMSYDCQRQDATTTSGFTGDMVQQAKNMGFLRYNATFGYRVSC